MKKLLATISAAALLVAASTAATAAITITTPVTYGKLVWSSSFTASGLTNCNQLVFDATGDLATSGALVLYGALNCSSGAYGMTGSLYTANDGALAVTMLVAGYTIACPRVAGFSGNCTVFDADGVSRGTGSISLL